jgi:hypothetical protein
MTVVKDSLNNIYLGDVLESTSRADSVYLSPEIPRSYSVVNNTYTAFVTFLYSSGLNIAYNVPNFEGLFLNIITNTANASRVFLLASAKEDTTFSRIGLSWNGLLCLYSDLGHPLITTSTDVISATNRVDILGNVATTTNLQSTSIGYATGSGTNFIGVANANSLGLLYLQTTGLSNTVDPLASFRYSFFYFALLGTPSGTSVQDRYVRLTSMFNGGTPTFNGVYGSESGNITNIVCGKYSTTTTTQNIIKEPNLNSDVTQYVYDFKIPVSLGGSNTLPNLKIGVGYYRPYVPFKLLNYNDDGINCWIPVGILEGRTVLMRCYSSAIVTEPVYNVPYINEYNPEYRPIISNQL